MGFNFSLLKGVLAEMSATKSDRSLSPAAVNEESRRDLLARQHRALYGNESPVFFPSGSFDENPRADGQAAGTPSSAGVRGPSPRGVDPFGLAQAPAHVNPDGLAQGSLQSPPRANSTSSPSSGINPIYGKYEGSDAPVTSSSSPGADSPTSNQAPTKPTAGPVGFVGPIGSRPAPQPGSVPVTNPALNKRSTTPIPSPLGFGFTPNEAAMTGAGNERSTSAASNPSASASAGMPGPRDSSGAGLGWGNGGGVWGSKTGLGVQASVWG